MSSALARKKRIAESTPITTPSNSQNSVPKPTGLTLPQVITVIDNRLIALETFVKDSKQNENNKMISPSVSFDDNGMNEFMNEIQTRYEILAQEIGELKDIVLKLQTYTMDVNKTLLEERIHILSDLGENGKEVSKNESFLTLESSDV